MGKRIEDEFYEFYVDLFADFHKIDRKLVDKELKIIGFDELLKEGYDVYHTLSHHEIQEAMQIRLEERLGLRSYEEQYRENYVIRLYHGTSVEFDTIEIDKCKARTDFGKGFYLGNDKARALNFAERKAQFHGTKPIVYEYDFYTEGLALFDRLKFETVNEEWARVISLFRTESALLGDLSEKDLIIGPVADDQVWRFTVLYLNEKISIQEFLEKAKPYERFTQYCFKTERSLGMLRRVGELKDMSSF